MENKITTLLLDIGVPTSLTGFEYLRAALSICALEPQTVHSMTKKLYPQVAQRFRSTPSRVERAMRHAVETAFSRGDLQLLQKIFRSTVRADKGKPTNSEFIALLSDLLRLEGGAGTWRS